MREEHLDEEGNMLSQTALQTKYLETMQKAKEEEASTGKSKGIKRDFKMLADSKINASQEVIAKIYNSQLVRRDQENYEYGARYL